MVCYSCGDDLLSAVMILLMKITLMIEKVGEEVAILTVEMVIVFEIATVTVRVVLELILII